MSENNNRPAFKKKKIGFLPVLMFTAAVVFFYLYYDAKNTGERLQNEATVVEGMITDKRLSVSTDYGDKYYFKYRYTYDYKEYTDENRVHGELWVQKEVNDIIPVRVQIRKPHKSRINSSLIFPPDEDYIVIAFALLITGLMFILIPYFKPLKKYLKERYKSKKQSF